MTETSVKEELHQRIDAMDERAALKLLAVLSLREDDGTYDADEEREILEALEDLEQGNVISQQEWEKELGRTQ